MSIYDDAKALGKAVLESDENKALEAAKATFESTPEAKELIETYTELRTKWQDIMANPESDKAPLTDLGKELSEVENKIRDNEITFGLLKAEADFTAYVNSIFNLISATIQGEEVSEHGCSPSDCASCGGSCH